jgi:hypothetical protein
MILVFDFKSARQSIHPVSPSVRWRILIAQTVDPQGSGLKLFSRWTGYSRAVP